MSIVLNETLWAEEAIKSRTLGKKPYDTIRRVARYYMDRGNKPAQVRKMIETFMLSCDPSISLSKWSDTIDAAIQKAKHSTAIHLTGVTITEPEMNMILSIEGRQGQRLAFTLMCLAKYQSAVNPAANGWVNGKDSEIMNMANIKNSIKRQSAIYNMLKNIGFIEFSKRVDNTNVRVCRFIEGKPAITITDFRNLGYQFNAYCGEDGYLKCAVCGLMVKRTGRTQKYCPECAAEVQSRNIAKYMQNKRADKSA